MAWPHSANPDSDGTTENLTRKDGHDTPGARTAPERLGPHETRAELRMGSFRSMRHHVYQTPAFPSPPTSFGREVAAAHRAGRGQLILLSGLEGGFIGERCRAEALNKIRSLPGSGITGIKHWTRNATSAPRDRAQL